ncbi:DUF262 domain-containing protein [Methylococcus capsulatus]|uniref:DUF262 domain-containing protein n=1 Tax=Methylococcus capsulatus TaxID=414 RepID=UPI001C528937|nr:DUF262 domain-containing protein [Methylococcus capsulatus]QXP86461.1 DUF262 domain-containing HNH endonuclease family protein [Methylococcus capsulatus]QXP93871.1 DUF262 domain-containing HNH endonuclease family protein [Methylococcus capsulatus]UQN11407.1 DUF262 domain-containing HNH endonuclease family protein [Methylococcus capsulatus]
MAATNFSTANRTYRELLGNGLTYRIPRFQRDYSWDEEHWEDLWADLLGTLPPDGEPAHYMGYLVLQTADNREFEVIDGQQRLTTLSLVVLAAMRLLGKLVSEGKNAEANQKRLDQLRATYIGYLNPVTLVTRNKLSLNRNNDAYYRDYLVTLADHLPQRGFPASTHAMRKGFEWFERRLREYVKNTPDQGMALAQFIDTMSDKLFFTVITVADELNAYKVFETLNARGVRLSATDLLKNYLFSVLARGGESAHELDELERQWEKMVGRLGQESFPDFLRMHWNSRQSFARQSELFKTIRNRIQSREAVFALLRDMDEDIDAYLALTQPEGSQWPPACKQSAQELRMFSVRQPYPMLMAARRKLGDADFEALLRATVVIAFRYNVIGAQHTGEQERVYHTAALKLHKGEAQTLQDVLETLRPVYRSDDAFRADFAEKSIKTTQSRNAKVVRYILCKLERQAGGIDFDPESATYTIEHVLPQSPQGGWEAFSDRDLENFVYRLGNMIMLEASKNKAIANQPYADKRPVLVQSSLKLTRELAEENEDWTPARIEARQNKLANIATAVWRIAQLS